MIYDANHVDTFGWKQPRVEDDGEHVYVHTYQAQFHFQKGHIENIDTWIHEFVELSFSDLFEDVRLNTFHVLNGQLYKCNPTVSHFLTSCFTKSGLCGFEVDGNSFMNSIRIPPKAGC